MMKFGKPHRNVVEMLDDIAPELAVDVSEKLNAMKLTNTLALLRNSASMTQEQLAVKMRCTQSAVSKLESSEDADVRIAEIRQVAKALGFDVAIEVRFKAGSVVSVVI